MESGNFAEVEWAKLFKLPVMFIAEVFIIYFQYQVLQKSLFTRKDLYTF